MKRTALAVLAGLLILCGSAAALQETAQPVPDSTPTVTSQTESDESGLSMSEARLAQLYEYSSFVNTWRFVSFFVGIAILAVIFLTGLSARFRNWAGKLKMPFLIMWGFLILFMVAEYILDLPFSYYRAFVVEHQFGFSNQTFGQWFGESLMALGLGVVFAIIPMYFFYFLINRFRRWWLWFSLGSFPLIVLLIVIVPIFVSPLFNEFTALEDKALEQRIHSLAGSAGIEGADVFQMDGSKQSTKVNAYVTGMFGTKRIVLYDTLIKNFTDDEIMFVMAHEMGHYLMDHIWWGVGVSIVFILFSLWLVNATIHGALRRLSRWSKVERLGDMASLPLILIFASVISFVFQPITNAASRAMERQADRYGMETSGVSADAAVSAFEKLSILNLSDPEPNALVEFWFYNHPALSKRIAAVRQAAGLSQAP